MRLVFGIYTHFLFHILFSPTGLCGPQHPGGQATRRGCVLGAGNEGVPARVSQATAAAIRGISSITLSREPNSATKGGLWEKGAQEVRVTVCVVIFGVGLPVFSEKCALLSILSF